MTPGYLVLDNGFDEVMEMPLQMSVVGGEAVKAGSSISSRCIKDVKIYSSDGSIHVDGWKMPKSVCLTHRVCWWHLRTELQQHLTV